MTFDGIHNVSITRPGNTGVHTFTPYSDTRYPGYTAYTIDVDLFPYSMVVSSGVCVNTYGCRICTQNTLQLRAGSLLANDAHIGGGAADAFSVGGTGGNGGTPTSTTGGTGGYCDFSIGGQGGNGGTSSTARAGGTGGILANSPPYAMPYNSTFAAIGGCFVARLSPAGNAWLPYAGGVGGGAGGSTPTALGGTGGGGGGVVWIAAQTLTGGGNLQALGGAGGAGQAVSGNYGGGGGGGGGGIVVLFTRDRSGWTGGAFIAGGTPGAAGGGTASAGLTGGSGLYLTFTE